MAEENQNQGNGAAAQQPAQPKLQVAAQYIKDMSFENIVAQKGIPADGTPEIGVQVSLDVKKGTLDGQFEVTSKFVVESKKKGEDQTYFLLELQYSGVFLIENVPAEQMHPFLMIECPRMLFPFARRIVHDVVRDGGFPPLNLDNIDWLALYRQNVARAAELQKAKQEGAVS